MNTVSIEALVLGQKDLGLPFEVTNPRNNGSFISVNNMTVLPIEFASRKYSISENVIIKNKDDEEIGILSFLMNKKKEISRLTEYQFAALLVDCDDCTIFNSNHYEFKRDYAIIDDNFSDEYIKKYLQSSPLWGLFEHSENQQVGNSLRDEEITSVKAFECAGFNTPSAKEAALRGLLQPFAFERFLKYYHLIELNFDFDLIKRIKQFDVVTQSNEMIKLLKEYNQSDVDRLEHLFRTYCTNIDEIVECLNKVSNYKDQAKAIFFDFGKTNNPLSHSDFLNLIGRQNHFSPVNIGAVLKNVKLPVDYNKFICKLTVYWIYRLRNSIAHNKIGEYLMTHSDEEFVKDFGEPLLMAFVKQVHK